MKIKFRVWDKNRKKMNHPEDDSYDGDNLGFFLMNQIGTVLYNDGDVVDSWENRFEVSQWSCMVDANGTDIYAGDILSLFNADGEKITVLCEFGVVRRKMDTGWICDLPSFHFKHTDGFRSYPIVDNYTHKHDLDLMEVTGNIYQSPEKLSDFVPI